MLVKKQQFELDMEQQTGSKLGNEYVKAVHCHPAYLTYMTNLDSIMKSRDSLPTKLCLVKTIVFPVVMYGYESWTIKKAECQRIDDFELWCCRRLLRVPWTIKRSNQSILKEISPEYTLEGQMLKLKFEYFGHLIGKDPDAGKD